MNNLLTGYLFTIVALSLAEGVSGIIGAAADNVKASINLSTAKKQIEISKLAEAQEQIGGSRAVGFTIPTDEEDDEDEISDEP